MQSISKRIVFLGIVPLLIMVIGVLAASYFGTRLDTSQDTRTKAATLLIPNISLSQSTEHITSIEHVASDGTGQDENIFVPIYVNPGGVEITGVDIVMQFDHTIMQLENVMRNGPDIAQWTFVPADFVGFDVEPILQRANSTGQIQFGAIAFDTSSNTALSGETDTFLLATLVFDTRELSSGTQISFVSGDGVTTDTNLASPSSATDVLQDTQQLTVRIVPNSTVTNTPTPAPTIPTSTPTPTPQPTATPRPPTNTPTPEPTLTPIAQNCDSPLTWNGTECNCPSANPQIEQGNANCDPYINTVDYGIWYNEWVSVQYKQNVDFDRSGTVDTEDYAVWYNSWILRAP